MPITLAANRGLVPASKSFPWPTVASLHRVDLVKYLSACVGRSVGYELGAKADSGGRDLEQYPPRYDHIDCSGFVRAALAWATSSGLVLPDGSVNQREWCQSRGLKLSSYGALLRQDSAIRICFIRPNKRHAIGHVYLCFDGKTFESWGGHGPGSRSPLVHVLKALTSDVYVLTAPAPVGTVTEGRLL